MELCATLFRWYLGMSTVVDGRPFAPPRVVLRDLIDHEFTPYLIQTCIMTPPQPSQPRPVHPFNQLAVVLLETRLSNRRRA